MFLYKQKIEGYSFIIDQCLIYLPVEENPMFTLKYVYAPENIYLWAHPFSIGSFGRRKTLVEAQDEQRYPAVPPEETLYSLKGLPGPGVAHKEAVVIKEGCGFLSHLKIAKHVTVM